jgi:hypothetical protein
MIIGINGKIGSGKDTIGEIIQGLCLTNKNQTFEIKKFAGKLKQIGSILTGIPVEKFEDQEFKKTFLSKEWNSPYNIPFSGPDFVKHDGEMTVREFLQKLGTEAMRDGLHTNVWVNALFADYNATGYNYTGCENKVIQGEWEYPNWIITDMRFPNEMEAVVERKGITIRVVRPHGYTNPHTGEYKEMPLSYHASETSLDDSKFDYEILNDGSIEDLVEKVREILTKENII